MRLKLSKSRTLDTITGMFFSNLIMYFIILTTAATLHAHGKTTISTAQDAAEALRPLAGSGAYWLFSLGLIGAGMLGVPVLAGSSAYAVAEAAVWQGSLADRSDRAREFYGVIAVGFGFAGARAELRGFQCGIHVVLGGCFKRRASAAADRYRPAADQQSCGHGSALESALAGGVGMDHGGGDDARKRCDVCYLEMTSRGQMTTCGRSFWPALLSMPLPALAVGVPPPCQEI